MIKSQVWMSHELQKLIYHTIPARKGCKELIRGKGRELPSIYLADISPPLILKS